jgi:hypothetical protein
MRLISKWLLVSLGGAVLFTVALSTWPDRLIDAPDDKPDSFRDRVVEDIFWPLAVCVYLSGHGAPIGPPEKHMYEATPVQVIAAFIGIGFSWVFYSSLAFLIIWIWKYRRTTRILNRSNDSPS